MIRLYRPVFWVRWFYRKAIFRLKSREKILCLTFDDGPSVSSTLKILEVLGNYGVNAIFFCSGRQASLNPRLMDAIRSGGHMTGNHGYLHLDGFTTATTKYIRNSEEASAITSDILFRPPYGRMRPTQYRKLSAKFRLIMWDLMAYDFDKNFGGERSFSMLKRKIRPGSIIVFHDTPESSVHDFLEKFLEHCQTEGYKFVLPGEMLKIS
jgi:peptidoglycan-N-acetylglucosamine deacetylase